MSASRADAAARRRQHRPAFVPGSRDERVIGICASTGGPRVLDVILGRLPADFPIPVLVVQHMTPGFLPGLVRWLDDSIPVAVGLARDGALERGVWFAPDHVHLTLAPRRRLVLSPEPATRKHRPSGDALLESLADQAQSKAVAVVLTGMGSDGGDGLARVRRAGGITIAQDEASSSVYGMPRVAAERGAELVLSPRAIGERLARMGTEARAR
jgi:two-component system chemotaxis response regulator CheB